MISLEVSVCDQRRSYIAHFANGAQAVDFIQRRLPSSDRYELDRAAYPYGNHDFSELEDAPVTPAIGPVSADVLQLLDILYPQCEHGLSADLCMGPDHYPTADQERAMGW